MNRRGNVPMVMILIFTLIIVSVAIFSFISFRGNITEQSAEINSAIAETSVAFTYVYSYAELLGKLAVEDNALNGGDIKEAYQREANMKDTGYENAGNFFGRIRAGDFRFEREDGKGEYELEIKDLFVIGEKGAHKITRHFDIQITYDSKGETLSKQVVYHP